MVGRLLGRVSKGPQRCLLDDLCILDRGGGETANHASKQDGGTDVVQPFADRSNNVMTFGGK